MIVLVQIMSALWNSDSIPLIARGEAISGTFLPKKKKEATTTPTNTTQLKDNAPSLYTRRAVILKPNYRGASIINTNSFLTMLWLIVT